MTTFYYTYKITLLKGTLAGHYYYGQHKTSNLNDGYAGSGMVVNNYYKKYGKIEGQTYVKSVLQFYNSPEELNIAEEKLVSDLYETDELCLNLKAGGNQPRYSEDSKQKISESLKGKHPSKETRQKMSSSRTGEKNPMYGKHHSIESRRKMSEHNGMKNPEVSAKVSEKQKGRKRRKLTDKEKQERSERMKKNNPMKNPETAAKSGETKRGIPLSEEHKQKISESLKCKKRSEETRNKMSEAKKGENNSAFGRKWMHNNKYKYYAKPEETEYLINIGFEFGYKKSLPKYVIPEII